MMNKKYAALAMMGAMLVSAQAFAEGKGGKSQMRFEIFGDAHRGGKLCRCMLDALFHFRPLFLSYCRKNFSPFFFERVLFHEKNANRK